MSCPPRWTADAAAPAVGAAPVAPAGAAPAATVGAAPAGAEVGAAPLLPEGAHASTSGPTTAADPAKPTSLNRSRREIRCPEISFNILPLPTPDTVFPPALASWQATMPTGAGHNCRRAKSGPSLPPRLNGHQRTSREGDPGAATQQNEGYLVVTLAGPTLTSALVPPHDTSPTQPCRAKGGSAIAGRNLACGGQLVPMLHWFSRGSIAWELDQL